MHLKFMNAIGVVWQKTTANNYLISSKSMEILSHHIVLDILPVKKKSK